MWVQVPPFAPRSIMEITVKLKQEEISDILATYVRNQYNIRNVNKADVFYFTNKEPEREISVEIKYGCLED